MGRQRKRDNIAVIDAETDQFREGRQVYPFIWGFYDGINYRVFRKTHELVTFLKTYNGYVYAHNGGKFDYHFLIDYAELGQKIKVINGRISRWKLGKCVLLDSWNILPMPLAAMEKEKFEYWKMDICVRELFMAEIEKYLQSDCVNLWKFVKRYINDYGQKLTQAGSAFTFWQEKIHKQKPYFKKSAAGKKWYDKFRPYYYGGRVTPFRGGIFNDPPNETFKVVDINSAYPRAMMEMHPWGFKYVTTKHPHDAELATALVTFTADSYGALPVRNKDGGISFPDVKNHTFETVGHELIAGIETGTVKNVKIIQACVFEQQINFVGYVNHFYEMKKHASETGDKATRTFAKLFLNSLYGKFASAAHKYQEFILMDNYPDIAEMIELREKGYEAGESLGNTVFWSRDLPPEKWTYYNIITAASITSWVRAFLWRSIQQVENPYYCDTDSIICDAVGDLRISPELGDWDQEAEGDLLAIGGKKLYALRLINDEGWKTASKGAKLTPDDILMISGGGAVEYTAQAPLYSVKQKSKKLTRTIKNTLQL